MYKWYVTFVLRGRSHAERLAVECDTVAEAVEIATRMISPHDVISVNVTRLEW